MYFMHLSLVLVTCIAKCIFLQLTLIFQFHSLFFWQLQKNSCSPYPWPHVAGSIYRLYTKHWTQIFSGYLTKWTSLLELDSKVMCDLIKSWLNVNSCDLWTFWTFVLENYFICSIFMIVTTKETILFHDQERVVVFYNSKETRKS